MTFEIIKRNFNRGLWGEAMVRVAVVKKVITPQEFFEITGTSYSA
jgi:hypothetical protein